MIFVIKPYQEEIGMVSVNARKIVEYAEKEQIFELYPNSAVIEVWEREKRTHIFDSLRDFVRFVKSGQDDDNDEYGGFW